MNTVFQLSRMYFQSNNMYLREILINYNRFFATEFNNGTKNDMRQDLRGGYAKAFDKFQTQMYEEQQPVDQNTFSYLLRNSKFVDFGDPSGKVVQGKIFKVVENDLYIDFGWKFYCVCPRPRNKPSNYYVRGTKVRLLIRDLELSSKFLGYEKDITLLEADGILLGLRQNRSA